MRTGTPHSDIAQILCDDIIRPVLALALYLSISEIPTLIALCLNLAFTLLKRTIKKMQSHNDAPFPFLELPQELRDMVYENLLEDPHYPPHRPCSQDLAPSWLRGMSQLVSRNPQNTGHKSNFLFLANKQIYSEYMELLCKKQTTVHLTVAPTNYAPPATPAEEEKNIWQISSEVLRRMKRCDITLATTSTMLGVPDPRNMKPEEWALARQMRRQLSVVGNTCELNLYVKAITDPLWNPLWIWYHAAQALRMMGSASDKDTHTSGLDESFASSTDCTSGPRFNRINFSLDGYSPGENYLMRDPANSNQWAWWCLEGHCVAPVGDELTVRQFCSRVYGCPTCEDEEDEESIPPTAVVLQP